MAGGNVAVKSLNSTTAREREEVDDLVRKGAKRCQMCSLMLMVLCASFVHRLLQLSAKNANASVRYNSEVWMVATLDVKKIYNIFLRIGQNILLVFVILSRCGFLVQL